MKKFFAVLTASAVLAFAGNAMAQDFPNLSIKRICKGDVTCPRFEQHVRGQVSGIWPTLPPDVRSTCLGEIERVSKSYRLLMNCLSNEMQQRVRLGGRQR